MNMAAATADVHHVGVYCLWAMATQAFSREIHKTHLTRFTSQVCGSSAFSVKQPVLTHLSY